MSDEINFVYEDMGFGETINYSESCEGNPVRTMDIRDGLGVEIYREGGDQSHSTWHLFITDGGSFEEYRASKEYLLVDNEPKIRGTTPEEEPDEQYTQQEFMERATGWDLNSDHPKNIASEAQEAFLSHFLNNL